ncbi:ABC transporter substrate-binding protein [Embleya sp. NPDC056575]|uniref:ABC transporter substrate-binding protein n=1 Tax=unclassified Embleya TaxID=2699296 RepID=UPI0036AD7F69
MRRASRGAAAALALGLLAAGCGGSGSGGSSGTGETVTIALPSDPNNMNPLTTLTSYAVMMNRFAYDSLVNVQSDGRIVSGVAEKWTSDANSATFTLRRDVTCENGAPLTAADVAAQYNHIVDPANKSPLYGLMVPPGVTATADNEANTVTLNASLPAPFLVRGTSMLRLVCPSSLKDSGKLAHTSDGTGPYRLSEVVPGDHFTFVKRAGYAWGPAGTDNTKSPDRVVFKIVGNESTRANLLLGGQIDIATVLGADRARLTAAGIKAVIERDPMGMLIFNEASNRVTSDLRLRKALLSALDLKQIGAVATGGKGMAPQRLGVTMSPPCTEDSVTGNLPPHDLEQAAALMREAGWKKSDGYWSKDGRQLSISMPYPGIFGSQLVSAVELAVRQWKSFGAKVSIQPTTASTNASILMGGQWEIAWAPVSVTSPDQFVPFVSGPKPPDGLNFGSFDNPEYRRLVGEAMAKPDIAGCPEWTAAESALIKRADMVTFVDSMTPYFVRGYSFELDGGGVVPSSLHKVGGR